MRVLIAHSRYRWSGGEETTVRNQVTALEQRGHDVYLHEVDNPSGVVESATSVLVAPFNPVEYRSARQAIREFEPDVVHVHNTWFQLSPAIFRAAEIEGVPSVATIQNYRLACPQGQFFRDGAPCTDCLGTFPWSGVRHACYRDSRILTLWNGLTTAISDGLGLLESIGRFIVPSEFARQKLIDAGLPEERSVVVYNTVPDPGPRSQPPSASRTVVFVGRISREKGLESLVAAFEEAEPDLELVVIGDGPDREALVGKAADRVTFLGSLSSEDVSRHLRSARALIFPSIWFEVCPLVILEALAAGLPVLVSPLGAMPEILGGIDSRLLVESRSWFLSLARLGEQGNLDEIGSRSRALYEARFRLETHAMALEDLYRSDSIRAT